MSGLRTNTMRRHRALRDPGLAAAALTLVLTIGSAVPAQEGFSEPVLRVEEDWMLVLNEPNGNIDSPQFHTLMSPFADTDSFFAQVLWNYRETPEFISGGVQLQSYDGESLIRMRSMEYGQLSGTAETITWTQSLSTNGAELSFEVSNGLSATWNTFGRDMRISADADLASLDDYDPDVSARESCVTYGSNRVEIMVITQVRYYGASGLLGVDDSPRVVFELNPY